MSEPTEPMSDSLRAAVRADAAAAYRPPPAPGMTRESLEHILQFFAYHHLPPHLQDVSRPFLILSEQIMNLPRNPERTVALRKLLEAKDAAVRAALAK